MVDSGKHGNGHRKRWLRLFGVVLLLAGLGRTAAAQELAARVNIQTPTAQAIDRNIINQLRTDIANYLNTTRFSSIAVAPVERIQCQFTIVINSIPSVDRFEGSIQVQAVRPVYGGTYETLILNFQDRDFRINYQPFQPLQFSENTYISNLVSILNFYAYTILGIDADSFAPEGGTPFYQRAQQETLLAQGGGEAGWRAADNIRNRYWLNENLLNGSYTAIRNIQYAYHRQGLDQMASQPAKAREVLLAQVEALQTLFQRNPNAFIVRVWLDTKGIELAQAFQSGSPEQKQRFLAAMNILDPSNMPLYQRVGN